VLTGEQTRGERDGSVRGKLLYTPDEATEVHVEGDYAHTINMGITGQPAPGALTLNGLGDPGHFNVWSDGRDISDIESVGASIRVDHRFDDFRIASISAYRNTHGIFTYDQDLSPMPLVEALSGQSGRMFSQELHVLSSASSKFQWLVGVFYYNYHASEAPEHLFGEAFGPGNGISFENKSYLRSESIFGQATYPLLEDTNLTLGVRYTGDQIYYTGNTVVGGTSTSIDGGPIDKSFSYTKPTWRLTLDHKITPDVLGYVSYNRGVKSGNIGLSVDATVAAPYQPEQLDAYEVGLKSELFEHRIRLNGAIYDYDFKNFQYSKISNGAALIFNGPSAKAYGGELELLYVITENLTVNANVGLEHTRIGNFPDAPNTERLADGLDNSGVAGYNAQGNQLPFAPKVTANLGYIYKIPTAYGSYDLGSNVYRFSGAYTEIDNRLRINAYTLLSATLAWTAPGDKFSVQAWGKNLTNAYYAAQLTSQANGTDLFSAAAPRTYGVTLGYKFK
jgi:iron complex outermembrane receptor protein